jgi:polysaccharide pyruvyl transferase WcaK-like protein
LKKLQYYINQLRAEFAYLPKNLGYLFSSKKRAIYIGCTGHENLGDEVVYDAVRKLLGAEIYLYPIFYIKPSSGKYLRRLIVKKPDLIILGGGTLIRKKISESYLRLFYKYHQKYPSAKLAVYGSGVGDTHLAAQIGFPTDVENWKGILNKCIFIGVRGKLSKKVLEEDWKVTTDINILNDPAIYFKKEKVKPKKKQKRIGINFCDMGGRLYGLDQKALETFAQNIIRELSAQGWNIFLYPTVASDLPYMKQILGPQLLAKVKVYNNYKNFQKSLSFLESMDVLIGQRLHSVIFAAISYTPFYAIEYEVKTSDFLNTLGLCNVSTRTDQLNVESVIEKVARLYSDLDNKQMELFNLIQIAHNEQNYSSKKFLDLFSTR